MIPGENRKQGRPRPNHLEGHTLELRKDIEFSLQIRHTKTFDLRQRTEKSGSSGLPEVLVTGRTKVRCRKIEAAGQYRAGWRQVVCATYVPLGAISHK